MGTANPLLASQREKSGAVTFDKFDYQYHWALFELLQQYEREAVSIVFVELHEDVVFADSEDGELAQFLFCQVKNTGSNWTTTSLVRRSKGKAKDAAKKNSVLGKMLLGVESKNIAKRLSAVELVATTAFTLKLAVEGIELNPIPFDKLHDSETQPLRDAIQAELGDVSMLSKVAFRKSGLVAETYDTTVIGLIAKIVSIRWPGSRVDASGIYTALIDELHRKGKVAWDFVEWDDLVRDKGVPTSRVGELFGKLTQMTDVEDLVHVGEKQLAHWGLPPRHQMVYRKVLRAYAFKALTDRSLSQMKIHDVVSAQLRQAMEGPDELTYDEFKAVLASAPPEVRNSTSTAEELMAIYVIEYLKYEK